MANHSPVIVDLGMSDTEYLACLAQGKDPIKRQWEQAYAGVLIQSGMCPIAAEKVAPLLDKWDCSFEERILVNQALRHLWNRLITGAV
jgi:hypothetical protein